MKKLVIILMMVLALATIVQGELISNTTWWYDETGGLNASWIKWDLDGGTVVDDTDNFENSGTTPALYGVNASFPHDEIITIDAIWITDDNPGRNSHIYILNSSPDNDVGDNYKYMIWVDGRDTWGITENGVTLANGAYDFNKGDEGEYTIKIVLYPNKTIELWIEGSLMGATTANSAMVAKDDAIAIHSYTNQNLYENSWDDVAWSWEVEVNLTLTINTDLINNTIDYYEDNITINYNGTGTTDDLFNCTLYVDGQLNQTDLNVSLTINQDFFVSWGGIEKDFTFEVQCVNYLVNDTTGVYNYKVDSISPRINEIGDFEQNSTYHQVLSSNVTLVMNFYDPNRYAENDTLLYLGNNTVFWNFFEENVSLANVTKTFSNDPGDLWVGSWLWIYTQWDSHTDERVKNLTWYFDGNNLIAEDDIVWEGDFEELDGQGQPATYFYLSPDGSKYKLKMTWPDQALSHTINISSPSGNLDFRPDDGWEGHFVYFPTERWIDHEGTNIESVDVVVLGANKWELTINHYSLTDEVEFESIGDLNRKDKYYQFEVSNDVEDDVTYEEGDYSIPNNVTVTGSGIIVNFSGSTLSNGSLIITGDNVVIVDVTIERALIVTGENVTYDTVLREGVDFEDFRDYEGTTDLITYVNLTSVSLTLENNDGAIVFSTNVDLTAGGNLDSAVEFSHNVITVTAANLDVPATLTFKDSGYTNVNQFLAYRDGNLCSGIECSNVGISNGDDVNVDVTGFSTYSLIEIGLEISQENFLILKDNMIYILAAFALVVILIAAMFIGLIVTGGDLPWMEITVVVLVLSVGFAVLTAVFVIIMNNFVVV